MYRCVSSLVAETLLIAVLHADILHLNIFTSSPGDGVILLTICVACTLNPLFEEESSKIYTKAIVGNGFRNVMGLFVRVKWGLQYSGV